MNIYFNIINEDLKAFKSIEKREKIIFYEGQEYTNSKELVHKAQQLTSVEVDAFIVGVIAYMLLRFLLDRFFHDEVVHFIWEVISVVIMLEFPRRARKKWIQKTIQFMKDNNGLNK